MNNYSGSHFKVRGTCDIVFLIDVSKSMASSINGIKDSVGKFFEDLQNKEIEPEVRWNCRATVYGYRDFAVDGVDNWFVANPFTRDPEEVRKQLDALVAFGGGDGPRDLLDALHKIAEIGESAKDDSVNFWKWRYHTQATRHVVVFTDATFHGCSEDGMEFVHRLASDSSKTGEDVVNAILQNKLRVSIYAPDFSGFGWNGYAMLDHQVDTLEYEAIPIGPDNDPQRALAEFTGDKANFKKTLAQLAETFLTKCGANPCMADTLDESDFLYFSSLL